MNFQKGIAPIISIIVIVAIIVGAVVVWQYLDKNPAEQPIGEQEKEELVGEQEELVAAEATAGEEEEQFADWKTYRNEEYGFEVKYPQEIDIVTTDKNDIRINLYFTTGTNLSEKYLRIITKNNVSKNCFNPLDTVIVKTEIMEVNGIEFKKESGDEGAAGTFWHSVSYSTMKDGKCFGLAFVLKGFNAGAVYPMPPEYDSEKESIIFNQILSTFRFID